MEVNSSAIYAKSDEVPPGVKFIRLVFCDFAGIRRCRYSVHLFSTPCFLRDPYRTHAVSFMFDGRVIPARRLDTITKSGVGLTKATPALPVRHSPTHEALLVCH